MKYLKLFEELNPKEKNNNEEGTLLTEEDLRKCKVFYAKTISHEDDVDRKIKHKEDTPLKPIDVDKDGVTTNIDNHLCKVKFENVIKVEF